MTAFPFTALVGQEALREALLVCAVDPLIGGVLVRGERGTAKSTAVRALAPLLGAVRIVEGCRYSADPDDSAELAACPDVHLHRGRVHERPVALVELPVGATADRVVGTLDLDRALADGAAAHAPGILAAAHRGILYADEVNLLPDHVVDVILDAAALGTNHVERDSISVAHPARFLLVGTMNPEEGELRPQLLDRFGLSVEVVGDRDPAERVKVVRRRLLFDADPPAFVARFAAAEADLAARVAFARERLAGVRLGDRELLLISATCARLGVDGLRGDLVCARAARALAALDGADEVDGEHVRRAALLALAHRRRRGPLEQPGLSEQELDEALAHAAQSTEDDDEPPPEGGGGAGGGGPAPAGESTPDGTGVEGPPDAPSGARDDGGNATASASGADEPDRTTDREASPASPAGLRNGGPTRNDPLGAPGRAPLLMLAGLGRGAAGRRSRAAGRHGQPIDSRPPAGQLTDLAPAATLRAAAQRRASTAAAPPVLGAERRAVGTVAPHVLAADLREHLRAGREGNLVVFVLDASGSMGARRRMATVKGAVLGLLLDAYQRRDRVALVALAGEDARVVLPPTSSVERAAAALAELPAGGGTPLAAGCERASALIAAERLRDPERRVLALLVTDGRASGGGAGREAAREAALRLARSADGVVVFDAEQGQVRLGLAGTLAAAIGARLLPLSALEAVAEPATPRGRAA